jgi:hypothetical protein
MKAYWASFLCCAFFLTSTSTFACDCIAKEKIDVKDWNDTEQVFTAILIAHQKMPDFTMLEFKLSKSLKGDSKRKVTTYIRGHRTLHHIDTFFKGHEWVVFGYNEEVRGNIYFRLSNPNAEHCGTSRPLQKDDHYLSFITKIKQHKGVQSYTKNSKEYAKGILKKGIPKGKWIYNIANNHYWEGQYKSGRRSGSWYYKGLNIKDELVILEKVKYKFGSIKSKYSYDYKGRLKSEEHYGFDKNTKDIYSKGKISRQVIQDLKTGKTTRLFYKNGKFIKREVS